MVSCTKELTESLSKRIYIKYLFLVFFFLQSVCCLMERIASILAVLTVLIRYVTESMAVACMDVK